MFYFPKNFGNWAIEYELSGTVFNNDTTDHTFQISFVYPGCDSAVAYQVGDADWDWSWMQSDTDPIAYVSVDVSSGETAEFSGRYMMAGPSCGAEHHTVTVL